MVVLRCAPYLCMLKILANSSVRVVALGDRNLHVPEEAEPFIQEVIAGTRQGEITWAFRISVILAVCVHAVIVDAVDDVTIRIPAGGVLELDLAVAGEQGTRRVVHALGQEVLVDARMQMGTRGLRVVCHGCRTSTRRHHAHGNARLSSSHGGHVGHVDVVHVLAVWQTDQARQALEKDVSIVLYASLQASAQGTTR